MTNYAVIVQNDESKWDDTKGDLYHYPSTYKNILTTGCKIAYYKGTFLNPDHVDPVTYRHAVIGQHPARWGTTEALRNGRPKWGSSQARI